MTGAINGRRVLVTGHTGFKGSWLAVWLHHLGAELTGYALDPETPSLYESASVAELFRSDTRADIRDAERLRRAVEESRPEVVFHLAAQPLVRRAFEDPAATFEVNVMGTVNLLEAVRAAGRPCAVVVVTSDKCYDNAGGTRRFNEDDRLGGSEAYGASKAAAEIVVAAYRHTYFPPGRLAAHGVRLASVRAGNVIGGGDWAADRILPDIVAALAAGKEVAVRSPGAVRPWQHVCVPLSGYIRLAGVLLGGGPQAEAGCSAWNFGPAPGDELAVGDLVERAVAIWGEGSWAAAADRLSAHEAALLQIDASKAERLLGWRPAWGIDEALRRTLSWYKAWMGDPEADMRGACLHDVVAYESAQVAPRITENSHMGSPSDRQRRTRSYAPMSDLVERTNVAERDSHPRWVSR